MTDREEFELKISMEYEQPPCIDRDCDGYADGYVDNAWWGWQARGELDAVHIEGLEGAVKLIYSRFSDAVAEIKELTAKLDKAREALSMASWNQIGGYEGQQKWLELNRELDK